MGKIFVKVPVWNIESETGYKPMTTFWQDFSIADAFGVAAVESHPSWVCGLKQTWQFSL